MPASKTLSPSTSDTDHTHYRSRSPYPYSWGSVQGASEACDDASNDEEKEHTTTTEDRLYLRSDLLESGHIKEEVNQPSVQKDARKQSPPFPVYRRVGYISSTIEERQPVGGQVQVEAVWSQARSPETEQEEGAQAPGTPYFSQTPGTPYFCAQL